MNIGKEGQPFIVEPLEDPVVVPLEPISEPAPIEPAREPEKVPA